MTQTPLAWLNLTHDKRRFALSLAGVGFAVVLMFVELGFRNALLDSTVALIDRFDADLVMVSANKTSMQAYGSVPRRRLVQALGVDGVASVRPLYLEMARSVWHRHQDPDAAKTASGRRPPTRRSIRVLAVDPDEPALTLEDVRRRAAELRLPDSALFDRAAKPAYGKPDEHTEGDELASKGVRLAGTFRLGTDFVNEGNVVLSDAAFAHYFPQLGGSALRKVEVGMIKLKPGADPQTVKARLNDALGLHPGGQPSTGGGGDDVKVLTKAELRDIEQRFWNTATPIGTVFGMGLAMGLVVGVVICYQVLATDVADHLPEFATLKAMGYGDGYMAGVVLTQALWLAVVGFVPGALLSAGLYWVLNWRTGLPLQMTIGVAVLVLGLTVLMCSVSGLLALRKLRTADPADLF
jgi:putative ABC transport system permease protein